MWINTHSPLAGVSCDSSAVLGGGARQGAPGTPIMRNYVTRVINSPFVKTCGGMPAELCPILDQWPIFWHVENAYILDGDLVT